MKRSVVALALPVLLALACNAEQVATATPAIAPTPAPSSTPAGQSERRCGDGVCDGPENAANCPQDCPATEASLAAEEGVRWVANPTSGVQLYVRVIHPEGWGGEPLPTLVLVPGGTGDSSDFLGPRYERTQLMADEGFVLVVFDPDGRGRSGGEEDQNGFTHQDGLAAVIRYVATLPEVDETQIGLVSYSYGVTMAAGALARYPDLPVRFLIDWEGPANRNDTGGCDEDLTGHLIGHPCDDEDFWSEREASIFALDLQVVYQRLQSEKDHAQPDNAHALLMIANATAEKYGGHGQAPWTRLNDLPPNTVYSVDDPPPMIPEGQDQGEVLIPLYARELLGMD